jgi:hypothetical protein
MSRKVMKLIDPLTGLMECKVCGSQHFASIRPGHGARDSWQCRYGCKLPESPEPESSQVKSDVNEDFRF